ILFFFSSRRRHTRSKRDWSSDVCSSDLSRREIMSAQFSVMPFRYSNDVAAMVAFPEELGLRRRIDSEGFAELHAGAGRVMVHAAGGTFAGGQTYLNLMAKTVEDAVDLASRIGLEYLVWDEAYGRHAV